MRFNAAAECAPGKTLVEADTLSHSLPPSVCLTPTAIIIIIIIISQISIIIILVVAIISHISITIIVVVVIIIVAASLSVCLSVCLSLSLSLFLSQPNRSRHMAAHLEPGSARCFCLLKGSFSLPLSPRACSWWELSGLNK